LVAVVGKYAHADTCHERYIAVAVAKGIAHDLNEFVGDVHRERPVFDSFDERKKLHRPRSRDQIRAPQSVAQPRENGFVEGSARIVVLPPGTRVNAHGHDGKTPRAGTRLRQIETLLQVFDRRVDSI
jgi:hypothetical protein